MGETSQGKTTGRRVRDERTTASSNVFSRLTAPTKAAIGKSKRKEDKTAREEWRKTMNSQIAYEESLMNMGGFVMKEQRYKPSAASRSPQSAKLKKKEQKRMATTGASFTDGRNQPAMTTHSYSGNFIFDFLLSKLNFWSLVFKHPILGSKGLVKRQMVSQRR